MLKFWSKKASKTATSLVVPPSFITSNPPEQFDTPRRGNCTWHTIFSHPNTATDSMCSGIAVCQPRTGSLCPHRHKQSEIYYIISGRGIVKIEGKEYEVEGGSSVFIPGDAEHGIFNTGEEDLRWFYVFPTGAFSDIVYRFSDEDNRKGALKEKKLRARLQLLCST